MTTSTKKVSAGLVFLESREFDVVELANHLGGTLERLGTRIVERRCLSDELAVIRTNAFDCRLQVAGPCHLARIGRPAAQRLMVTLLCEGGPSSADMRHMQATIAHLLAGLQSILAPDFVQWTDPNAVLTRDEFRAAVAGTAALPVPTRVALKTRRRRKRLPDVESAYAGLRKAMPQSAGRGEDASRLDMLRAAFCDPEPDRDVVEIDDDLREKTAPMRLAVWMMTIAVGIFALPVAIGLTIVNLLRGENLRLASQTAALSGTFMVLSSTGQIAHAAAVVQTVLP
jgi:hypothetical protein